MKLCLFIVMYFGSFNNYFQLFLDSFSKNEQFDLLIITDQNLSQYSIPGNVKVYLTKFETFREYVQSKFDFNICLRYPYKLCDYKPAYGYLLEEFDFFSNYYYWGHIDCDMIVGNLSEVATILESNRYLKIFANGHMTIYFNSKENNSRFMHSLGNQHIYIQAFTKDEIYGFDEGGPNFEGSLLSVHEIFMNEVSDRVYTKDLCFNSSIKYFHLRNTIYVEEEKRWITSKKSEVLKYSQNALVGNSSNCYIYCHLQGRKMKINISDNKPSGFYILPFNFVDLNKKGIWFKNNISFKVIVLFLKRLKSFLITFLFKNKI